MFVSVAKLKPVHVLQVPLPRGLTALHWLQGQSHNNVGTGSLLQPKLYFSPRQSAAPGTEGAAAAEAALAGAGPVAGLALLIYHVQLLKEYWTRHACECMTSGVTSHAAALHSYLRN